MNNGQYSVEVLIHGKEAKEYSHYIDGEYKTFIEGRAGTEYSLRITNRSNQKLLAICAVDSINVVNGKVSDGYKGRGYIINPYDNVIIKGYRESDSSVGAFKFTSKHKSYAQEKGVGHNSGIIAVNLITEKIPVAVSTNILDKIVDSYPPFYPKYREPFPNDNYWEGSFTGTGDMRGASFTCSSDETPVSSSTGGLLKSANFNEEGTWGQRVEDKITRKHFEKGNIVAGFKIYYASRPYLESMGVNLNHKKEINEWPNGFENEYAKPPRGWK